MASYVIISSVMMIIRLKSCVRNWLSMILSGEDKYPIRLTGMGEFWGIWSMWGGLVALALSVAVVFSLLLGVRTGRIRAREMNLSVSRIRQN